MGIEVTVQLSTFDKTRSAEVTLDRSFTVTDLIEECKKNWALPSDTQYHILNETRGCQLQAKSTLAPDLVQQNDRLVIQPMLVAGAMEERLRSDLSKLLHLEQRLPSRLKILSRTGNPPDNYRLQLNLRSIERLDSVKQPVYRSEHVLRITFPPNYPLPGAPPEVQMETPIYHPHVFTNLKVCIGSKHIVGEFLDKFVERIAAIICFDPDYFDFNSPANSDASTWVKSRLNTGVFPTDKFVELTTSKAQIRFRNL